MIDSSIKIEEFPTKKRQFLKQNIAILHKAEKGDKSVQTIWRDKIKLDKDCTASLKLDTIWADFMIYVSSFLLIAAFCLTPAPEEPRARPALRVLAWGNDVFRS